MVSVLPALVVDYLYRRGSSLDPDGGTQDPVLRCCVSYDVSLLNARFLVLREFIYPPLFVRIFECLSVVVSRPQCVICRYWEKMTVL